GRHGSAAPARQLVVCPVGDHLGRGRPRMHSVLPWASPARPSEDVQPARRGLLGWFSIGRRVAPPWLGCVLVAPAGQHTLITSGQAIALIPSAPVPPYPPSA